MGRPAPTSLSKAATDLEYALASGSPDVVFVGNSKVDTDFDAAPLATELGVSGVVALPVYASNAATWFAVLKNRVFANGHRPRVVVVYAALNYMIDTAPGNATNIERLEAQMSSYEPEIQAKTFADQSSGPFWDQVRRSKTGVRSTVVDTVKYTAAGVLYGGEGSLYVRGQAVLRPALDKTFGSDADFLKTSRSRVVPVAEQKFETETRSKVLATATYIPDLVRLSRENGASIVFVRAPVAPASGEDTATSTDVEAVVALLNSLQVPWLDLSSTDLASEHFRDGAHLNSGGRTVFLPYLAAALRTAMDGPFTPAVPPLPDAVLTRVGVPPDIDAEAVRTDTPCGWVYGTRHVEHVGNAALAAAGVGLASPVWVYDGDTPLTPFGTLQQFANTCGSAFVNHGAEVRFAGSRPEGNFRLALAPGPTVTERRGERVAWVYPGSGLHFEVAEGWNREATVIVEGRVFGEGEVVLAANGGAPVPLQVSGRVWRAEAVAGPGPGLQLDVSSEKGWAVVDRLWVQTERGREWLWGKENLSALLRFTDTRAVITPPESAPLLRASTGPGGDVHLTVVGWGALEPAAVAARADPACAPLRPWSNGKELPVAYDRRQGVWLLHGKPFTFSEGRMQFTDMGPHAPPREYEVRPTQARRCEGNYWVFPGESVDMRVDATKVGTYRYGANRVDFRALSFGETPGTVEVKVLAKGEPWVSEQLVSQDGVFERRWEPTPLQPRMGDVLGRVTVPEGAVPVLVQTWTLSEGDRQDAEVGR